MGKGLGPRPFPVRLLPNITNGVWEVGNVTLKSISKKTLILLMIMVLLLNLFFVPRSSAFLQFAIGGLALGEAAFYTVAVIGGLYTFYEAYDSFKNESMTSKYIKNTVSSYWSKLSTSAKEGWAALEEGVRAGTASLVVTAAQWKDALMAGSAAFSTDRTIVPPIPLPYDTYNQNGYDVSVDHDFFVKYAVLEFEMNGEKFALMPYRIVKNGLLDYKWHWYNPSTAKWHSYYRVPAATAFIGESFSISTGGSGTLSIQWYSFTPPRIYELNYSVPSWQDAMIQTMDALPVLQSILESVYGGTAVSMPQVWSPTIPKTKDRTKPAAIPVPAGALDVPGTLTLNPADVKTAVGTMTGDVAVPGEGTIVDTIKNFFDLSKPIDWSPMKGIPQVATKAFPFSLPWDVGRAIDTLTVTGKRPEFELTIMVDGKEVKQTVPFGEWVDPIVPYIRSGIVFLFTFGLIFATRKLFGGAK